MVLAAVIIFGVGVGVGNGTIAWRGAFGRPVASGLPEQLNYSSVDQVYQDLKNDYDGQLSETQLLNGIKTGLANATGDPHTEYFTAAQAKEFSDQLNNSFSGVGAELGKDSQGNIDVISPIKGFSAAKAGLKAQDIITSINGVSTSGMSLSEAVGRIRGKSGTKVNLTVVRDRSSTLHLTITRENIKLPSVTSKILPDNIGYMQISTFGHDTSGLARKTAQSFAKQHVRGVILDLRGNPGGLLDAAVNVSSLWLKPGKTVLQEKRGNTVINTYTAQGGDVLHGVPTVVLIDGGSASASEITAGALHDNGAARLIGTKSYGKGSVQQIDNLADGSELKVTIARWYRPDGQNIDKKGITPDQIVQMSDQGVAAHNDTQLTAAEDFLTSPS